MKKIASLFTIILLALIFYAITFLALSKGSKLTGKFLGSESRQSEVSPFSQVLSKQTEPSYKVIKVIDGDTIDVEIDGKVERIRLIGVDAPESVDPRNPIECFGNEASAYMKQMLTDKEVILEEDPTQQNRDVYNRLLRYVYLQDGTNVGKKLIEDGYAFEFTYRTPYLLQAEFKSAQSKAENENHGMWDLENCSY